MWFESGDNVLKEKDIVFAIIMVGAFVATFFLGINVIYIILVCGFIGAAKMLLQIRKIQKEGDSQ